MTETLSVKLIRQSEYQSMPWKNGLGSTQQIDINPSNAAFPSDPFLWRLSSATISGANDFSSFSGYDRILAVWMGSGLVLNKSINMDPFVPLSFQGEEDMHCELANATSRVVDYGVIYHRESVKASMSVSSEQTLHLPTGNHYITVINGSFTLPKYDFVVTPGDTLHLNVCDFEGSNVKLMSMDESSLRYFHVQLYSKINNADEN